MTSRVSGTLTDNGSTASIVTRGKSLSFIAGSNVFGGGTITLELQLTDGSWQAFNTAMIDAVSAEGQVYSKLEMPDSLTVRATLAGATGPNIPFILQG